MFMRVTGLLIVLCGLGSSLPVLADFQSDVLGCWDKSDNNERLECYDTVVKYYKNRPSSAISEPVVQPVVEPNLNSNSDGSSSDVNIPVISSAPVQPKVIAESNKKSSEDTFGKSVEDALESIQSRIIGEFKGWEKGMKLKLENGQIWKVMSDKAGYKKMTNPTIIITRGFFGSFNAKVENLNAGAKVKRIK